MPSSPSPAAETPRSRLSVLFSFMRPHLAAIVVAAVLGLAATAAALWTPRVVENVVTALTVTGGDVDGYLVLLAVVSGLGIVLGLVQGMLLGRIGERVVYNATERLLRHFVRGKVLQITSRSSGDLVSRATADTGLLRAAVASGFTSLLGGVAGIVGSIVMMGVIDIVLLGLLLGSVVVFGGGMAAIMPLVGKHRAKAQEAVGRLGGQIEGATRAIRTVKVAGAEDARTALALAEAETARRFNVKAVDAENLGWTVALGGVQLASVAIIGIGAWRVSQGYLSIAALIAFLMYIFNFVGPMMELGFGMSSLQSGLAAADRIAEAQTIELEEPGDSEARTAVVTTELPASPGTPVLELRDVTASYNDEAAAAVTGISLSIPRTGHTALVGPSGAGKTTLLSMALRFLAPESGSLLLDGVPYDRLTYAQVRSRFAYVEQETPVVPGTIRDNLLISRPDAPEAALWEVLRTVQLADDVAAMPDGLDTSLVSSSVSGGQRQRIAMARALLADADVLLLDEATSQLDGITEAAIHQAILAASSRGAVVTVAHRLSTVLDADTIVVMEAGRIRATGTHAELLAGDDLYRELVAALRIGDNEPEREPAGAAAA